MEVVLDCLLIVRASLQSGSIRAGPLDFLSVLITLRESIVRIDN